MGKLHIFFPQHLLHLRWYSEHSFLFSSCHLTASPTVLSYSPFWCHKKVGNTASNSYMHVGDKNAITHMSHEHYGIQNHWQLDCLFDTLSWLTSEKTSTLTDFFWERNPPVGFPTQRDSNVESVFHVMTSPPWRDHESLVFSHRQQVS